MTDCSTCGNQSWLCQQCKLDELEARHGTPADQKPDHWVLDGDLWHASTGLDNDAHLSVCGAAVVTPVEWVTEDLRHVPDEHDAPVCRDCVAALEGDRAETVPEDATFERASQLRADGGTTLTEGEQINRAVREAADLVDAGDSILVAVDYVVGKQDIAHRRDDVLERVRDRLEQGVATDGGRNLNRRGRDAFLAGDAHWCDLCERPFDRIDDLANHDCRSIRTDGGTEDYRERLEEIDQLAEAMLEVVEEDPKLSESTILHAKRHLRGVRGNVESAKIVLFGPESVFPDWGDDDDDDGTPIAITDGGRPQHRANCEDCPWSYSDEDLVDVSDKMERHVRKEIGHDVDLKRAVATDGGHCLDGTERNGGDE